MNLFSKIKRKSTILRGNITSIIGRILFKIYGIEYGKNLKIRGLLRINNFGKVRIGDNVTINSALWANPISSATCTCFQIAGGELNIGDYSGISNSSIICQKKIIIGNHVLIGANCQIFDTDFHPLESRYRYGSERNDSFIRKKEVVIEDGVFIGANTVVLKGSKIGKNSIIGAASVVSGEIPENQIWAGVPARYIKDID